MKRLCQDLECIGAMFCEDCVEILDREILDNNSDTIRVWRREEANNNGDNISLEAYNERF